jgi:hypothetical protein
MMHYFNGMYNQMLHHANQLSPQQWVMLLAIMLGIGVLCLRGFGSRSNY